MEHEDSTCSNVCVAVKIRPLVPQEHDQGCKLSLSVTPGRPQVFTGHHEFTYDHVFGAEGSDPDLLYARCVSPLVEGLFKGYNATVFAYGQTGSGKTHTMGSEYKPGGKTSGVIPEAISAIFSRIAAVKDYDCCIRVSFVEIHKEEIKDLLISGAGARAPATIRENPGGGVSLYGAVEREVRSVEEMAAVLEMGTLCRSTASTGMNSRSSRSHAIYTITVEQKRQAAASVPMPHASTEEEEEEEGEAGVQAEEILDDYLCAKMHLVDLAGSERAKRTKAEGARLKEGIHINKGLLALGNVINAIVDNHKHVPYRDSKLTRLLQDSLGGNSRTVMIACVSPADINFEESLNTLRYADRARHIRNKPVVNRDPMAAQVAALRQQIAALQAENVALKRAAAPAVLSLPALEAAEGNHWQLVEQLQQEMSILELENAKLKVQLESTQAELASLTDKYFTTQAQLDLLQLQLHDGAPAQAASPRPGHAGSPGSADPQASGSSPASRGVSEPGGAGGRAAAASATLMRTYLSRIADLEKELRSLRSLQQLSSFRRRTSHGDHPPAHQLPGTPSQGAGGTIPEAGPTPRTGDAEPAASRQASDVMNDDLARELGVDHDEDEDGAGGSAGVDEQCFYAEMAAHTLEQEKMKQDMAVLQRVLEQKERKMQELMKNTGQVPALKQHYDRVLQELEKERDTLQSEKVSMMQKLQVLHTASEEERKRLEAYYKEKIAQYDERLREVRRKERDFMMMQKLKQRSEELCSRLNGDISRIKQQKVALQKHMEASARQFAAWRVEREKEVVKLRRQNRRNTAHIQQLEALQAKQNAVLQRKIVDANMARKKLKDMQAGSAAASRLAGPAAAVQQPQQPGQPGPVEIQPNAQAPLLRTERARREWLEKELDLCNQSYEYQRVLDGELAQRADTNRQLKEVEKRLMLCENLVPASPLVIGGMPVPAPMEDKGRLLQRKEALVLQLAEHNAQIKELQAAWEAAKLEEEGRGGGAADAKRWTGIRNVIESRELLRTLFRVSCDYKAQANDTHMEIVKLQEELGLIKVQLDAARKEGEAQRKRAAAIEATAATAMAAAASSTPYSVGRSGRMATVVDGQEDEDVMDADVDDLLQELQAVSPVILSSKQGGLGPHHISRLHEAMGLDGTVQVHLSTSAAAPVAKALNFPSPKATGRYGGTSGGGAATAADDSDEEMGDACHEALNEGNDEDDDDDDDEDWDPSCATPARPRRGSTSRRSSSREPESSRPPGSGFGPLATSGVEQQVLAHLNSSRLKVGLSPVDKLTVKLLKDQLTGQTQYGKAWRAGAKTKEQLLHDYQTLLMGVSGPSVAPEDLPISSAVHRRDPPPGPAPKGLSSSMEFSSSHTLRASSSQLGRTTSLGISQQQQAIWQQQLQQPWRQIQQQEEVLLRRSQQRQASQSSAASAQLREVKQQPVFVGQVGPVMGQPSSSSLPPGSTQQRAPQQQPLGPGPGLAAGRPATGLASFPAAGAAAGAGGGWLNVPAAQGKAGAMPSSSPPSPMAISPAAPQFARPGTGLGIPLNIPDSPLSDFSLGDPPREHAITPLSRLYIQKAQEARERTAQLRQSIQKGGGGREAAAAARAVAAKSVPRMSLPQARHSQSAPDDEVVVIDLSMDDDMSQASPSDEGGRSAAQRPASKMPLQASSGQALASAAPAESPRLQSPGTGVSPRQARSGGSPSVAVAAGQVLRASVTSAAPSSSPGPPAKWR